MTDQEIEEQFQAALAAVTCAVTRALALIRDMPPGHSAFSAATELHAVLREAVEAGAQLRSRAVRRIRDNDRLSLAGLANRLGVSKQRAAQLTKERP